MAVKELIGLFESSSRKAYSGLSSSADTSTRGNVQSSSPDLDDQPPPRFARFLKHPELRTDVKAQEELQLDPAVNNITSTPGVYEPFSQVTPDVTDEPHVFIGSNNTSITAFGDNTDNPPLVLDVHKRTDGKNYPLGRIHQYPPSAPATSPQTVVKSRHRPEKLLPHTPVPVTTLFARKAIPLYLPKLDDYLSSLKPPKFTLLEARSTSQEKENECIMFPPMCQLAVSGQSIEELEANSRFPSWRNRGTIIGAIVNVVLGFAGSNVLATYYSLQGLFNAVQVFALLLSTIVPVHKKDLEGKWRRLFLGKIPNILALNFASTHTQALFYLIIFMGIAAVLLYQFYYSTSHCQRYHANEGLQEPEPRGSKWGLLVVTFLLTVIYLPLSTLAVHVLVWSQDLWVVPNPYINATSQKPGSMPIERPNTVRDQLDLCWTTTMSSDQINFAPLVMIISAIAFLALTLWFPIRLRQVIQHSAPRVDPFTELGQPRSNSDMDREYQRLIYRDRNPFAFLYIGFRRNNATYQSTHFFAKLSTLFIVAVLDPDNCLFRSFSQYRLDIARQVLLVISALFFFALQCYYAPFMNPVDNASEWISRLNYIATACVALAIALNVPHQDVVNGPILYIIYAITYGFIFYFLIIDTSLMHRIVKRISRRIDFSLDMFSPRLDLSSSLHVRRRIWQESITTLLLTTPECHIPKSQSMVYAEARDSEYPPYLLNFMGMIGERHVENLKILRDIGTVSYVKAVGLFYGPDRSLFKHLEGQIQKHFVGPDSYWKPPHQATIPGCTNFFGNAWWIPFPPTLVIKYDDGRIAVLKDIPEFETYIAQNSSLDIRRRRETRMAIRALDGQTVLWPYEHLRRIGSYSLWCCGNGRYKAETSIHFQTCVLRIKRRGHLLWRDMQLGGGFGIELEYAKDVRVDGTTIGLNDDFDLTKPLARFLLLNRQLVSERLDGVLAVLEDYRVHHWKEARFKNRVLTYRFLSSVYDQPQNPTSLVANVMESEKDLRVRQLISANHAVFQATHERWTHVSSSAATRWWYIFWDDLWRRNHSTIAALRLHATEFNPHYPTSIAYIPLPRPALEAFLIQRGLLSHVPKWGNFFHTGFLNKLYLRLNDTVFAGSSQGILFHVGDGTSERDMLHVDLATQPRSSTMGTGGGTDYDESSILARPTYKWEALFEDSIQKGEGQRQRWFAKMGTWLGITPFWNSGTHTRGLAVDVRLENGRSRAAFSQRLARLPSVKAKSKSHLAVARLGRRDLTESQESVSDSSEGALESQSNNEVSESEEDDDLNAPRAFQWLDEDDLNDEDEDVEDTDSRRLTLKSPAKGSELPFGTLIAARQPVPTDEFNAVEMHPVDEVRPKRDMKPEWSTKRRPDLAKRSSKHAPAEYSSKRPVSRKRTVVEVRMPKYRDPRFLPVSGVLNDSKFQEQYNFLADLRVGELATLREHLKHARKLLKTSQRHLRTEREQEVARLELAVKRIESLVNRDKQEKVERETLSKAAKEEKEKRRHGKRAWWMKKSEKKSLLMRARYDALAATKGKQAVKEAIEKRRKKISQKEKRSRPFARRF